MSTWIAFVVLMTASVPSPAIDVPFKGVTVNQEDGKAPSVDLQLKDDPNVKIGRMTGVEVDLTLINPTATNIGPFGDERSCETGATRLRKAVGVASVTCVETR